MNLKPSELTNAELIKKEKTMRVLFYTFAGVLIVLFALVVFNLFQKHFGSTVIMPVILLPILVMNLKSWRELKEEIKARGL